MRDTTLLNLGETSADATELLCPKCDHEYVHHTKVEVFERAEDASTGYHVSVTRDEVNTDSDVSQNPSERRNGLTIHFECEGCGTKFFVSLSQHKGLSLLRQGISD